MTQTIRRSDKELQTNVTEELLSNPAVDADFLTIMAHDGVVTLSGVVSSLPERFAATRSATRVWGVRTLVDDIVVRAPSRFGAKDTDIAEAARQLLSWAVDVPSGMVHAGVRDRTITLSGTVHWQYQREAAVRAVLYLRGITGVINAIALSATMPVPEMNTALEAASRSLPSSIPPRSASMSSTRW